MLLVKTYIGKSKISGIGLFAAEPIRKGQAFWKWNGKVDWKVSNTRFSDPAFDLEYYAKENKEILHFGYTDNGYYKICGDDAKYMNHSFTPNTESFNTQFDEIEIANKDIEVGEELTCDYFKINDDYSRPIFEELKKLKKMIYNPRYRNNGKPVLDYWESPEPEKLYQEAKISNEFTISYDAWLSSKKTVDIHPDFADEFKTEARFIYRKEKLEGFLSQAIKQGIPCDAIADRIEIKELCKESGHNKVNDYILRNGSFSEGQLNITSPCTCKKTYAVLKPLKEEETQDDPFNVYRSLTNNEDAWSFYNWLKENYFITRK